MCKKTSDLCSPSFIYKGFTLIELLVVIVLIGILTVIAAPDYLKFRQKIDLESSTQLLQAGLNDAYSLARSRSKHYLVQASSDGKYFTVSQCDTFDCLTSTLLEGSDGNRNLEGKTVLNQPDFALKFQAPHGDVQIKNVNAVSTPPDWTSLEELTITLNNQGLEQDLLVYAKSGLVTTATP